MKKFEVFYTVIETEYRRVVLLAESKEAATRLFDGGYMGDEDFIHTEDEVTDIAPGDGILLSVKEIDDHGEYVNGAPTEIKKEEDESDGKMR